MLRRHKSTPSRRSASDCHWCLRWRAQCSRRLRGNAAAATSAAVGGHSAQGRISLSNFEIRDVLFSSSSEGNNVQDKILSFLSRYRSIHDTTPLESTLRNGIGPYYSQFITSPIYFALSVTNLNDGKPEYFYKLPVGATLLPATHDRNVQWRQINSFELLLDGLIGSTALPVIFPPRNQYFDGGVLLTNLLPQRYFCETRSQTSYTSLYQRRGPWEKSITL